MSYATVAGVGSTVELGLVDFLAAIDPLRQRRRRAVQRRFILDARGEQLRLRPDPHLPGQVGRTGLAGVDLLCFKRMKRLLLGAASIYVLCALIGRFVEAMGAVECECRSDCWCKKPVLSTFRWAFPAGHSLARDCS